jgi:V/A-type H+/Na+-transporting ATPase subunit E
MAETTQTTSGVQELIDQIRDEGIKVVKQEAEKLVLEAKEQAASIVAKAKAEVKDIRAKAETEIAAEKATTLEALQLAARDTVLRLGKEVMKAFEDHVRRLVSAELKDEDVLRDMILAIAGKSAVQLPKDQEIEILLSTGALPTEDSKGKAAAAEDRVKQFILKVTRNMLREGIELKPGSGVNAGIRVRLKNEDLEIDLTEKAVAELLVQHLLPRYRKIVRGQE